MNADNIATAEPQSRITVDNSYYEKTWMASQTTPHTHATTEIQEKDNLIKQDFSSSQPLKKLLTDI